MGFPNVGKSTILSKMTTATPKIANYHFTTIDPNLGVVDLGNGRSFVLADIPGIIEGASEGVGLGLKFLRHVERTRLLIHVVDISGSEGRNPVDDFNKINEELKNYSEKLSSKKQIVACNKIDILPEEDNKFDELSKVCQEKGYEIFKISAATGEGMNELFNRVYEVLQTIPKLDLEEKSEIVYYTLDDEEEEGFEVHRESGKFVVTGKQIENLMRKINFSDYESLAYFHLNLKKMGVDKELRRLGAKNGDIVQVFDWEFEFEV